jgi:hypothetical protein
LRIVVNEKQGDLNSRITKHFGWNAQESIEWCSPVEHDRYAEYSDEAFLDLLGLRNLKVPLNSF